MSNSTETNYVVVSCSNRENSQSIKVSNYITETITTTLPCSAVDTIDLATTPLTLWPDNEGSHIWERLSSRLTKADAFIFVVPEWHGMAPPAIKNVFIYAQQEFAHKPALIVSVSAGHGGCQPITDLRLSTYKNSRICYIPEHIIIRNVETILEKLTSTHPLVKRIKHATYLLHEYALVLKQLRNNINHTLELYPYGMS